MKNLYSPNELEDLRLCGEHLRQLRLSRQLTQEKMAELTGLNRNYWGEVERGERNISLLNLIQIARTCGIPLREVLPDVLL